MNGVYDAPFDINSKNFTHIPEETGEWFDILGDCLKRSAKLTEQGAHALRSLPLIRRKKCVRNSYPSRSLHISTNTVLSELKKKEPSLESVNTALLNTLNPDEVTVDIERAGEAEMDEMWSFVGRKDNPCWLWHAIDHQTGEVLAYVFGHRKDEVFLKLKELLNPFGLTHYYTDKWGAYTRHLDPEQHTVSKRGTQKIERMHLTLRARIKRLVRQTICYSKSTQMHDIVIGLFVNRYAFGRAV